MEGSSMSTGVVAVIVSVGALSVSVLVAIYQRISGNSASWWSRLMDAMQLTASDVEHQRRTGWILVGELSGFRLRSR